jgi:hypothetical protein
LTIQAPLDLTCQVTPRLSAANLCEHIRERSSSAPKHAVSRKTPRDSHSRTRLSPFLPHFPFYTCRQVITGAITLVGRGGRTLAVLKFTEFTECTGRTGDVSFSGCYCYVTMLDVAIQPIILKASPPGPGPGMTCQDQRPPGPAPAFAVRSEPAPAPCCRAWSRAGS